jgi:hypothetical protein
MTEKASSFRAPECRQSRLRLGHRTAAVIVACAVSALMWTGCGAAAHRSEPVGPGPAPVAGAISSPTSDSHSPPPLTVLVHRAGAANGAISSSPR